MTWQRGWWFVAAVFVVAGALPGGGRTSPAEEAQAWISTEVRRQPMPPGTQPDDLKVSPDAQHVAFVQHKGDSVHLVLDGVAGPAFDAIDGLLFGTDGNHAYFGTRGEDVHVIVAGARHGPHRGFAPATLQLSADGRHVAYVAHAPAVGDGAPSPGVAAHLDGVPGPAEPAITALALAADGSGVAYIVKEADAQRVVLRGGPRGEAFDEIDPASLRLGAGGRTPAYTARRGAAWHVVFGDHVTPAAQRLGGRLLTVSPDGTRCACWVASGPKPRYLVDGAEHMPFTQVGNHRPLFSKDSKHIVYTAQDDKGWHLVRDGVIVHTWTGIAGHDIAASHDASLLLYAAQRDGRWWMQAGATTLGPYDAIGDRLQALSPDGAHHVFAARRGSDWHVVHDGKEAAAANAVIAVALSPDGTQRAYGAIVGGRPRLVVGEQVFADAFVIPGGLVFDADGVLHAQVAQDPQSPQLVALRITRRP